MALADSLARDANEKNLVQKWTKPVYDRGWTAVPVALLEDLPRLGLRPTSFAVLIQLLSFWWRSAEMPYPSRTRLARRLGLSVRAVHRALDELEAEGLIRRVRQSRSDGGHTSNAYDLTGLVDRLHTYATEQKGSDGASDDGSEGASNDGVVRF